MKSLLLNGDDWTLTCWWKHQWRRRSPHDQPSNFHPALPPMLATVPGAVHADLRRAGHIRDWNLGLNSLTTEWVNHRDWAFTKRLDVPPDFTGQLTLEFDGIDYAGHVALDGEIIAQLEGTHFRHEVDLTHRVQPGGSADLEVMIYASPEVDGVFGYTSRTRIFKPRFGYYWDWCARLVNTGIWQDVRLVARGPSRIRKLFIRPTLANDNSTGVLDVTFNAEGAPAKARIILRDEEDNERLNESCDLHDYCELHRDIANIKPWWPATHGPQPLYQLTIELLDADGNVSDRIERTIGFRRVEWVNNPGAPEGARPYVCRFNGRDIFLRGVNWVPLSPFYGTVSPGRYETILQLYRNMNANLVRVWGGAGLETPAFYEACDRLGLLVWQEFPLSSSGIDNWPPEDPDTIEQLRKIAAEYIERRAHHVSHILWCGGNELQGAVDGNKQGIGKPVDESHPCIAAMGKVVADLDPGKRFLPTSPSGPRFFAAPSEFGKGLHHHTHGPWGNLPLVDRYDYYNNDDTLFRTETGSPGCASLDWIMRTKGDQRIWPPRSDNAFWLHPSSAWIPWDDVTREFGPIDDNESMLPLVVKASRYLQAESYRYAAEASRRRALNCSAFVIWMGHDADNCPANNSVIAQVGWTKPAYAWLQKAYAPVHVSAKHDRIAYLPGEALSAEVWLHDDRLDRGIDGVVRVRITSLYDDTIASAEFPVRSDDRQSTCCGEVAWDVPAAAHDLFVLEIVLIADKLTTRTRYLLSQRCDHPLAPLRTLPTTTLSITNQQDLDGRRKRMTVSNTGSVAAIGVEIVARSAACTVMAEQNHRLILPGESADIAFTLLPTHFSGLSRPRAPKLHLEWFNTDAPISLG